MRLLQRLDGRSSPASSDGAPRQVAPAVLRCPRCRAHFDAVHAGVSLDENAGTDAHLEPIPLLVRDGVLSVAVLAEATEVA